MKIAHLVSGGEVAGGQLVALQLAHAARAAGHEVIVVSPTPGPFLERATADGFATHVLAGAGLDLRSVRGLRALLRDERVELVHTHAHFALNVLGRLAGRAAGARVVAHMHIANVYRAGPSRLLQIALDDVTARLCAAIVAVSHATRARLLAQGYPRRIDVVHNGVSLPASAPQRPGDLPDAPLLVLVGRLAPVKGQHVLIDALALLENPDAVAVLVGKDIETDGAYTDRLRRQAEELGVADRVLFAGYRDDAAAVLAAATVAVLPSAVEGLPLVVLEAMAAGRPVVATPVGGTPELVDDGTTGLLVPYGDSRALATALDRLLGDADARDRFGAAGRRRAEREFSLEAMSARILAIYERAAP